MCFLSQNNEGGRILLHGNEEVNKFPSAKFISTKAGLRYENQNSRTLSRLLLNPLPPIAKQHRISLICPARGILHKEASGTLARINNDLRGDFLCLTNLLSCATRLLNTFLKCVLRCHPLFSRQTARTTTFCGPLDSLDLRYQMLISLVFYRSQAKKQSLPWRAPLHISETT